MTLSLFNNAPPDLDAPEERRALIALSLVPGVGAGRLRALIAHFEAPSVVFKASRHALTRVPGVGPQTADAIRRFDDYAAVDRQVDEADKLNADLVPPWDERFPRLLRQIYDPPAFLWMNGAMQAADERAIAIVGTRRCTDYGRRQAHRFAADLARQGITVISGLAYGIDAAAHRGALEAGGRTIGVLGSGLGRIYPARHKSMARDMAQNGAILSEYALHAPPDATNFPERNRIVSGLSLGTLVVESHEKGGALITARMAVEQNREVFAVPGALGHGASVGTNHLIQRGHAKLVTSVEDILDELNIHPAEADENSTTEAAPPPDLNRAEQKLYDAIGTEPVHIDTLCAETGLDASSALVYLLGLEFKGLVRQMAGKQFYRV